MSDRETVNKKNAPFMIVVAQKLHKGFVAEASFRKASDKTTSDLIIM